MSTDRPRGTGQAPAAQEQAALEQAALEPVANWTTLSRGDEVVIYANGFPSTSGHVEMRGLDGNVFWIMQKDGLGRSMVHKTDRLRVYRKRKSTPRRNRSYGRD